MLQLPVSWGCLHDMLNCLLPSAHRPLLCQPTPGSSTCVMGYRLSDTLEHSGNQGIWAPTQGHSFVLPGLPCSQHGRATLIC